MAYYVVDRFEGQRAIVVTDDGEVIEVSKGSLPSGCREGTVLRVDAAGPPDWPQAVIDEEERGRRLDGARDTLRRLGESDPGGDVTL
jgi:hypothetical protein